MPPRTPRLDVPELALVLLVGAAGSGKSTFARAHFGPYEAVSSDACRGMVANDPNDQTSTADAFALLHHVVALRLARGLLTVVDATNVQPEARRPLLALARRHHVPAVAIVLDLPERVCQARNAARVDRQVGVHVVAHQHAQLRRALPGLPREGFAAVYLLYDEDAIAAATVVRQPLASNRTGDHGPFDIIGDVHGCADEFEALLARLGYLPDADADSDGVCAWRHPAGRTAVFVGDLADRGPRVPDAFRIAIGMVAARTALAVPGNHDVKLLKALRGQTVQRTHGLAQSLEQLDATTPALRARIVEFVDTLPSHYVLDGGRLVVAHAGLTAELQGRSSGKVRAFALYGQTTGESDEFGLPVRYAWAADYRGRAAVVYGHTPVATPVWLNETIDIDTGCVFGGRLTALRWPERELVSVPALRQYAEPRRPFLPSPHTSQTHAGPASGEDAGPAA
ncbi:MAG TPA: AAA family ATPase [Gemmatirosa sp.]